MKLIIIILAGGEGSRLWPASTKYMPKQFLKTITGTSLVQSTYIRAQKITKKKNIYISTNKKYLHILKKQIPSISNDNIIVEELKKDTFFAISYATIKLVKKYNEHINVCFMPCDHFFDNDKLLLSTIKQGHIFVSGSKQSFYLIGAKPHYPENKYGYIKYKYCRNRNNIFKVLKFVEKPDYSTAKRMISTNNYLWNTGIIIFNPQKYISLLRNHLKSEFATINNFVNSHNVDMIKHIEFQSFDRTILEKSNNMFVAEYKSKWSDLGSWSSIKKNNQEDKHGNIVLGSAIHIQNSFNIFIYSTTPMYVNHLSNLIVINCNGITILDNINNIEEIKNYEK